MFVICSYEDVASTENYLIYASIVGNYAGHYEFASKGFMAFSLSVRVDVCVLTCALKEQDKHLSMVV